MGASHDGDEEGHEAQGHEGCCRGGAGHEGHEGNESHEGDEEGYEGNEGHEGHEGDEEGHESNEGHEGHEGNEGNEEVSFHLWRLEVRPVLAARRHGTRAVRSCLEPWRGASPGSLVPSLTALHPY